MKELGALSSTVDDVELVNRITRIVLAMERLLTSPTPVNVACFKGLVAGANQIVVS